MYEGAYQADMGNAIDTKFDSNGDEIRRLRRHRRTAGRPFTRVKSAFLNRRGLHRDKIFVLYSGQIDKLHRALMAVS